MSMRILVVGAGATGGYFGARLAQAGRDVTFLVHKHRAAELRIIGLQVLSPHGDFTVKPPLAVAGELHDPFDLVLVGVKAFSLTAAMEDLAPAVGPHTMILPLLNGMRHFEPLTARFGEAAVLGGLCRINALLDYRGRIVQLDKLHELDYGERTGGSSPRTEQLHEVLSGAGFETVLSPAIMARIWEKWTQLATLGGITCLLRGDVGEIARAEGGVEFALAFFEETLSVARAAGFPAEETFVTKIRSSLVQKDSSQSASMYRDLTKGVAIEADQIVGDLLAQANHFKLSTPLLSAAWVNLSMYQNRRSAKA